MGTTAEKQQRSFLKLSQLLLDLGIDLKKLFMRVNLCANTYLAV